MSLNSNNNPLISVIIPCKNEEKYIKVCLISLLDQKDLNDKIEILVVDGMSTDDTRKIVGELSNKYPRIKLINNPYFFTPNAMNIGIKESRGEFIAILGAHTKYSSDYLINCMELIHDHPDASCVGGPIISQGNSAFGKATALAMSSRIGVGNAKHRFPDYEGYAEGACFPVFKREVFSKIGLYDEELIKNQDDEFNLRLQKQNLKVYISSKIKSSYFVRESPKLLFAQYYDYGYWRVAVIKKHKKPTSLRQIVPIAFFSIILILIIISPILPLNPLITGLTLPAIYFFSLFLGGLLLIAKYGLNIGFFYPISVFIMHFAYAIGFVRGIIKFYLRKWV